MANDDLKSQALNSSQDFYALLSIPEGATDTEIRTAYRKTARKYHPDKVGANEEALKTFHLLQIAYDVLSDPAIKELYDNARRAKQAKAERHQAYEGHRKEMIEKLERAERAAMSTAMKRKRGMLSAEEEEHEMKLQRLQEDGKRRRKEREEMLRREEEEERKKDEDRGGAEPIYGAAIGATKPQVDDIDRTIKLRFPQNESTSEIDKAELVRRFERFGPIEAAVVRDKKIKVEGLKHRQPYVTAAIEFKSVLGSYAAVTDFPQFAKSDPATYGVFEAVNWAAGQPPAFIRPSKSSAAVSDAPSEPPETPVGKPKVPRFTSFKPAERTSSPGLDEITRVRLRNAEKRRMEEKIRREEAEAEQNEEGA